MVKVHVWLPDSKHVGHTSLSVKNEYVSFWPDGEAGKKDLKIKRSQPGMLIQRLHEDIRNEGGRHPITIDLPKLNEEAVLDYIAQIQRNTPLSTSEKQLLTHNRRCISSWCWEQTFLYTTCRSLQSYWKGSWHRYMDT